MHWASFPLIQQWQYDVVYSSDLFPSSFIFARPTFEGGILFRFQRVGRSFDQARRRRAGALKVPLFHGRLLRCMSATCVAIRHQTSVSPGLHCELWNPPNDETLFHSCMNTLLSWGGGPLNLETSHRKKWLGWWSRGWQITRLSKFGELSIYHFRLTTR